MSIPNIVLKAMLKNKENMLNLCHLNACSVFPKINSIRQIFNMVQMSAIAVSETWLTSKHTYQMISLSGYSVVRHDRNRMDVKRGGGVCVYINKNLTFKVLQKFKPNEKLEYILLELVHASTTLLFGAIYNPPRNVNYASLLEDIEDLSPRYENIVLTGDLNIDQISSSITTRNFRQSFLDLGLTVINHYPTHFSPNTSVSSCIDLLIVSDTTKTSFFDQISLPSISHHDLIVLGYDVPTVISLDEQPLSELQSYKPGRPHQRSLNDALARNLLPTEPE